MGNSIQRSDIRRRRGLAALPAALVLAGVALGACTGGQRSRGEAGIEPLLLDTDPALGIVLDGEPRDVDDGFAIVEAINAEELDLLGITIVFGNSPADQGFEVASRLVAIKSAEVPVVRGADGAAASSEAIETNPAVEFLAERLRQGPATVAAIGPLTNIAGLVRHHPDAARNIRRILAVMGRSPGVEFYLGDAGPVRDFNFEMDPVSAEAVFAAGIPMALLPFELTSTVVVTAENLETIRNHRTPSAAYLHRQSQRWLEYWTERFPTDSGFHPWDSAAIAYLTHPETLVCERRGYRIRTPQAEEGAAAPHLELDPALPGDVQFCHAFQPGRGAEFIRRIIANVN